MLAAWDDNPGECGNEYLLKLIITQGLLRCLLRQIIGGKKRKRENVFKELN